MQRNRQAGETRSAGRRTRRAAPRSPGRLRRTWTVVAMAAVVATAFGAPAGGLQASSGAAAAAPTVTATPADGLTDGQTIRITSTGLADAFALQCSSAPRSLADCDLMTGATPLEPAAGGTASGERRLFAVIHTEGRGTVDCRIAGSCVVAATVFSGSDPLEGSVTTPVAFDAAAPLLPAPTITATPSTDLVDGQVVRVEGRDLGHRGAAGVQVLQCGPQPSFASCRSLMDPNSEPPEPGPDGSLTLDVRVWQVITTDQGDIDCRAPSGGPRCVLVATTRPGESLDPLWAAHAPIAFDEEANPGPAPTVEVAPSADLGDVTELTVRGRDFTPGAAVRVSVCDAADPDRCDGETQEWPTPDAAGAFELRMNAFATFGTGGPEDASVDCRATGCVVAAEDQASLRRATAPLAFGPPGAPRGRYLDPVFDDVDVVDEIVYRRTVDHHGNEVDLRLDIYRPAGDTATSRPAVIWMHGGWFRGGDGGGGMPLHASAVAQRGYVGVDIGYRVRPEMDPNDHAELYAAMIDAYEDATAAVEWVRDHAAVYGIDPNVIMAGGFSAGAVTTSNLAYLPGQLGPDSSGIAAAIPLEGWFVRPDEPGLPPLGPFAVPDPGEPPAIVLHGTADHLMPWGSPADTCPMAAEAGIACEYVGYEGLTHGSVSAAGAGGHAPGDPVRRRRGAGARRVLRRGGGRGRAVRARRGLGGRAQRFGDRRWTRVRVVTRRPARRPRPRAPVVHRSRRRRRDADPDRHQRPRDRGPRHGGGHHRERRPRDRRRRGGAGGRPPAGGDGPAVRPWPGRHPPGRGRLGRRHRRALDGRAGNRHRGGHRRARVHPAWALRRDDPGRRRRRWRRHLVGHRERRVHDRGDRGGGPAGRNRR